MAFKAGQKATVDLGVPIYGISLWINLKQTLTSELVFLKTGTILLAIAQDFKVKIDGNTSAETTVTLNEWKYLGVIVASPNIQLASESFSLSGSVGNNFEFG